MNINKWFMYIDFESPIHYILDTSNLDVSNEEVAMCIQEQVYGDLLKKKQEDGE